MPGGWEVKPALGVEALPAHPLFETILRWSIKQWGAKGAETFTGAPTLHNVKTMFEGLALLITGLNRPVRTVPLAEELEEAPPQSEVLCGDYKIRYRHWDRRYTKMSDGRWRGESVHRDKAAQLTSAELIAKVFAFEDAELKPYLGALLSIGGFGTLNGTRVKRITFDFTEHQALAVVQMFPRGMDAPETCTFKLAPRDQALFRLHETQGEASPGATEVMAELTEEAWRDQVTDALRDIQGKLNQRGLRQLLPHGVPARIIF